MTLSSVLRVTAHACANRSRHFKITLPLPPQHFFVGHPAQLLHSRQSRHRTTPCSPSKPDSLPVGVERCPPSQAAPLKLKEGSAHIACPPRMIAAEIACATYECAICLMSCQKLQRWDVPLPHVGAARARRGQSMRCMNRSSPGCVSLSTRECSVDGLEAAQCPVLLYVPLIRLGRTPPRYWPCPRPRGWHGRVPHIRRNAHAIYSVDASQHAGSANPGGSGRRLHDQRTH